jgi:hypothetical protein
MQREGVVPARVGSGVTRDLLWSERARCWRGVQSSDRQLAPRDETPNVLTGGGFKGTPMFRTAEPLWFSTATTWVE